MGLEQVIQRINKQAEHHIQTILNEAEHQAKHIIQNTKKEIEQQHQQKKQETEKHITTQRNQEESNAQLEAKKIILNTKKQLLEHTYQNSLTKLQTINHEHILTHLIKKIQHEMPEATSISSNKRDEPLIKKLTALTYKKNITCIGGVIAENKDHTLKLDLRYETLAQKIWDDHLKEIATTLFE